MFLCAENGCESKLAETLFATEALNNDVTWSAVSRVLSGGVAILNGPQDVDGFELEVPAQVTADDLKNAGMTIVVQKNGSQSLNSLLPCSPAALEFWQIPGEVSDSLKLNIGKLLVMLILKGGKRAPLPTQVVAGKSEAKSPASTSKVRVGIESKGRGGKKVTIISGLEMDDAALAKLATELKQACGTGGTAKDGHIEIQGDQRDRILAELQRRGYKAKRSGG